MKTHGLMLVKNEEDIAYRALQSAEQQNFLADIVVVDLCSTDKTVENIKKYCSPKVRIIQLEETFRDQLKYDMMYKVFDFEIGDWFCMLDSDELYISSPKTLIEKASSLQNNVIYCDLMQFYITEKDSLTYSSIEEIKYYLINWSEPRFFRTSAAFVHSEERTKSTQEGLSISKENFLLRHYQFRNKTQMIRRIEMRKTNHALSGNFGHVKFNHWKEYIVPSKYLNYWDSYSKPLLSIPEEVNLFAMGNNPAFSTATINWLDKRNMLNHQSQKWLKSNLITRKLLTAFHRLLGM